MRGKIRSILFEAPLKPEGSLRLVQLDDGRLAMMRDDVLMEECVWPPEQVEASVTAFRKLQRTLSDNGQRQETGERAPQPCGV
jgi:hypothetical protein